jgi:hypothetical protein
MEEKIMKKFPSGFLNQNANRLRRFGEFLLGREEKDRELLHKYGASSLVERLDAQQQTLPDGHNLLHKRKFVRLS